MGVNPFVLISKLDKATTLLDAFSEILGEELADQDLSSSTYGPIDQDDTTLTVTYGGSINDFDIDVIGDTSWDNIESIDGVMVGDKGELTYEEMKVEVAGIGDLVSDGFSTFDPEGISTTSKKVQSLTFLLSTSGDITPSYSYEVKADADLCVDGECTTAYSTSTTKSGSLDAIEVSVSADLVVEIGYDKSSKSYAIEEYAFENLVITPNFETIYESAFDILFGTFSDWWDNSISDEFNPFTTIENEVLDQLETVDTEIEDEMASDLTDLINSDSVKGDLDNSFDGLLDYSWNYSDYLLGSSTSFRRSQSSRAVPWFGGQARQSDVAERDAVTLEGLQSLMDSMASRSKSKVIYEKEGLGNLGRDESSQFPHRFVFFRDEGYGKKKADVITNFDPKRDSIDLSDFKFSGLDELSFASVKNKKQLGNEKERASNIIYNKGQGGLYFDANGSKAGFGKGGMFALINSTPDLGEASFEIV
jgi:hypothetical protein